MKITSDLNTRAWTIRKEAAQRYGCKVMEISWAACLKLAKEKKMEINKGMYVSVKMDYTDHKGNFIETKYVADQILEIYANGHVRCRQCHIVSVKQIHPATPEHIAEIEKLDAAVRGMLNRGRHMVMNLREPELI